MSKKPTKKRLIPPLEEMDSTFKAVNSNGAVSKMFRLDRMSQSYNFPTPKLIMVEEKVKSIKDPAPIPIAPKKPIPTPYIEDSIKQPSPTPIPIETPIVLTTIPELEKPKIEILVIRPAPPAPDFEPKKEKPITAGVSNGDPPIISNSKPKRINRPPSDPLKVPVSFTFTIMSISIMVFIISQNNTLINKPNKNPKLNTTNNITTKSANISKTTIETTTTTAITTTQCISKTVCLNTCVNDTLNSVGFNDEIFDLFLNFTNETLARNQNVTSIILIYKQNIFDLILTNVNNNGLCCSCTTTCQSTNNKGNHLQSNLCLFSFRLFIFYLLQVSYLF